MMTISSVTDVNPNESISKLIMVTSHFTSKYKLMAFCVFGFSMALSLMLLFSSVPNNINPKPWNDWQSILIFVCSILIMALGCWPLLKMQILRIGSQRIIFQKYIFTSTHKETHFKAYDYYQTVHEESENGIFEAVWLIKDGKLKDSFSCYQYSNYEELKAAIDIPYKGVLNLSPMQQLRCKLGMRTSVLRSYS